MKILLLITALFIYSSTTFAKDVFTFGIVPQQSANKLIPLWNPILREVSKQSGVIIRFATASDIPSFEKKLASGEYDFSYMNPYHYVVHHESQGYQAINKAKDKKIKGIIVVAKRNNFTKLKDLNNSTLAFPSPSAFAASLLTRSDLNSNNINFKPKYVKSHDSVYIGVVKGVVPGGGGIVRTYKSLNKKIRDQLEILWTTKGYTPHAIAAHPRIDNKLTKKVQQAFADLYATPYGKELLSNIKIKGFEKATDKDWNDIRELEF